MIVFFFGRGFGVGGGVVVCYGFFLSGAVRGYLSLSVF